MGAGPTAHLNAAFLLLGLFAWARAVLIPSPFRKRSVQNLGAEEGAGSVELAEVTQRDDGIHGALETARGLGAGGDTMNTSAFTAQNLPATPEHRAWAGVINGLLNQQRQVRQPGSMSGAPTLCQHCSECRETRQTETDGQGPCPSGVTTNRRKNVTQPSQRKPFR